VFATTSRSADRAAESTPNNASSIDATGDLAYDADFGFELGGPIIKDKLWFFVGFAPQFSKSTSAATPSARPTAAPRGSGNLSSVTPAPSQGGFADGTADTDPRPAST